MHVILQTILNCLTTPDIGNNRSQVETQNSLPRVPEVRPVVVVLMILRNNWANFGDLATIRLANPISDLLFIEVS